jgi:glutaconate CoA-transferase subunit B
VSTKVTDSGLEAPCTPQELMVVAAAHALRDGERVLVGIGMPNLAATLAKRTFAPDLVLLYESGVVDARPSRLPLAIADPCLVTGAVGVTSMFDFFALVLQGGWVDVGFLGGAQVDRFGNINSTVVGSYHQPKVRLPGSGGACDIATHAKRLVIMLRHDPKNLPERVDFVTSPGHLSGSGERARLGLPGGGPAIVVTDLALLDFTEEGEMQLRATHPGVSVDRVLERTGWPLRVAADVRELPSPAAEELRVLREELDVNGVYLPVRKRGVA